MEGSVSAEMPRYKCHKEVHALKIVAVQQPALSSNVPPMHCMLSFEGGYSPIEVDTDFYLKHRPQAGGYYVLYEDGYASYSPAKAFEEGYTRI
jgi:hypothetical protein